MRKQIQRAVHAHKSSCSPRVAIMAGVLTFVAPILESGTVISGHQYIMAAPRNYIAALMLQILIALPFGLFVLARARRIMVK